MRGYGTYLLTWWWCARNQTSEISDCNQWLSNENGVLSSKYFTSRFRPPEGGLRWEIMNEKQGMIIVYIHTVMNRVVRTLNHSLKHGPVIDFENSRIIDKRHYRIRKTLDWWHTATTKKNARTLPSQYFVLTNKRRRN